METRIESDVETVTKKAKTPSTKDASYDESSRKALEGSLSSIASETEKAERTKQRKKIIGAIAGALFAVWAIHFAYISFTYESTDDAQVAAHTAVLSARVGGIVNTVNVDENTVVKAGDTLATIDQRDYQNAVKQADGDLGSLEAKQHDAERTYHRMQKLFKSDAISQQQMDDAEESFNEATRRLSGVQAQVDQAKLNLDYTNIKAPSDGKMGKKSVEPGMVVSSGQMLFTFVDTRERWVTANFKETQLRKMKIGQEAEIEIDAVAGKTFLGKVDSFAPGSGSTFALIPPDNATGNYTKIVQRVPVKIVFDKDSIKGYEDRIVPGISAIATVRVR
jgi:membrane fusion protein (multidrug efflux system)